MMTISGDERKDAMKETGPYIICIFAHMTSSFSLIISETP
jgi:hypothetical protein